MYINKKLLTYDKETGLVLMTDMGTNKVLYQMEGFFVYNRPEQILENYELELKGISKGRDCYICDTEQGALALYEYSGSKERATFYAEIQQYLFEKGILTEQVITTKDLQPIVEEEDGDKWILLTAFKGAECDVYREADMRAAAESLARIHAVAQNYDKEVPEFVKIQSGALLALYEKRNRELRQVRNYIRNRKQKNIFEALYMKYQQDFMEKGEQVVSSLRSFEGFHFPISYCHGDFNQHNLIFSGKGNAIIGTTHFSYGIQISDLANFIRKMLEKNSWNVDLGVRIISAYEKVKEITTEEKKLLYCHLAYPEKFWKIANHYNNSKKVWLSDRNLEKIEKVIEQERSREEFLENLFDFIKE